MPAPTSSSASLRLAVRGRRRLLDDGRHPAAEALAHFDDHPPPGRSRSARPPRGAPSPSGRPARGSSASVKATKVAQTLAIRLALAGLVLQACRPRSAPRAAARRSVRWCPTRPPTTPACAPATSSSALATRVDAPGDVTEAVLEREPGDRVAVTVQRDGEHRTIEVRLGEQPRRAPRAGPRRRSEPAVTVRRARSFPSPPRPPRRRAR